MTVYKFDTTSNIWNPNSFTGAPALSNINGWNYPQFYSTIKCINDGTNINLFARSIGGIMKCSFQPVSLYTSWNSCVNVAPQLSDANGLSDINYYSTIQYVKTNSVCYVVSLSPTGVIVNLLDETLILYLPFNNTSQGTTLPNMGSSGGNYTLSAAQNIVPPFALISGSQNFSYGVYATLPTLNNISSSGFTISTFISINLVTQGCFASFSNTSSNSTIYLYYSLSPTIIYTNNNNNLNLSCNNPNFSINKTDHFAVTFSNIGGWTMYINGVASTLNNSLSYPLLSTMNSNFIGNGNIKANFNGTLNEFRLYNRVLSPTEIFNLSS